MNPAEFHRALLTERYGQPVPEWKPPVDHLIAAGERVALLDEDTDEQAAS